MDLDLTPEQELIRDTVRTFARERVAPVAEELDREARFAVELVREMAKTTKNKREIARALGIAYHVVFNILKRGGYSAASSLAASTETVSFSPSSKLTSGTQPSSSSREASIP